MQKFAANGFPLIVLGFLLHGCTSTPSAEDVAVELITAVNSGDAAAIWLHTSAQTRDRLMDELNGAKSTEKGRQQLGRYLGVSTSEIGELDAEDYFALMMTSDPGFGVQQLELVDVEISDDRARILYRGDGVDGVNILIKEDGHWRFDYGY